MSYLVSDLKSDLTAILHGTTIDQVVGVDALIDRAARQLLLDVDPQETKRSQQLNNQVYSSVYDYQLPSDLKGDKIIDIRPQVNRGLGDNPTQTYSKNFDLKKTNNSFDVKYNSGVKSLRYSKTVKAGALLNEADSITSNGTWAVGGDATNLTEDGIQFVSGSSSLNFDLDGSTTSGYIQNSTMTAVDLSESEDISSIFVWVYIPDTSIITSVDLRWGSSTTAYWNRTVTQTQDTTAFQTGWNLLRFDWNGATETGSPDSSAINMLRVTINYDGTADTDFRVDNIISRRGAIFLIDYYSKFIFRSSAGTWQETVSDDTDIINLDTDSYNLLLNKVAEYASRNIQGEDSAFDYQTFKNDYDQGVVKYRRTYKSEILKPQNTYYDTRIRNQRDIYNTSQSV